MTAQVIENNAAATDENETVVRGIAAYRESRAKKAQGEKLAKAPSIKKNVFVTVGARLEGILLKDIEDADIVHAKDYQTRELKYDRYGARIMTTTLPLKVLDYPRMDLFEETDGVGRLFAEGKWLDMVLDAVLEAGQEYPQRGGKFVFEVTGFDKWTTRDGKSKETPVWQVTYTPPAAEAPAPAPAPAPVVEAPAPAAPATEVPAGLPDNLTPEQIEDLRKLMGQQNA